MQITSTNHGFIVAAIEKLQAITWPNLLGSNEPVEIFDGFPGPNQPDNLVIIGGDDEASPAVEGGQTWAGLGATRRYEDYSVTCLISCFVGGDSDGTALAPSDAQNAARQNAYAVLGMIESTFRADPQLLQVANPPSILWCEVGAHLRLHQTGPEDPEIDQGRAASLAFTLHVRGRI